MAMEFLREVASAPPPRITYRKGDIDGVRRLRAAGLVIAQIPDETVPGEILFARALAVIEEGHREMLDIR